MTQTTNQMEKYYINIAILGPVSAGKSTLMNSIFVAQYSDMKIKRTTMTPQIYEEYNAVTTELTEEQQQFIRDLNYEINNKLVTKTENDGDNVTYEDISEEVVYKVPRVHDLHNLTENVLLRVYDIPGLNDSKTADLYFKYLDTNFHKFDLIIFVVDIYSACNTEGEVKILQNIVKYTKRNRELYNIHNKLIIVANKCDDLHISKNGKLTIENDELVEMYKQIKKEVDTQIAKFNPELNYSICPLSAEDSYIYRMYSKNTSCKLDIKHVNKFGMNEYGKSRWNRMTEIQRHDKIRTLMSKIDITKTLQQTGFTEFADTVHKYLSWNNQYNYICGHTMYSMGTLIEQYESKPDDVINLTDIKTLYTTIDQLSYLYNNNTGIETFYKYMSTIMKIHMSQLILRESDKTELINEVDLEHYEWAQKHCHKWQNEFGEKFTTLKEFYEDITNLLNKYYEANINKKQKPVTVLLSWFYKMFSNRYKITRKIFMSLFTNNDMLNKKPSEIIKIINDMRDVKIIEDKVQALKLCKDLLHRIYDNIYNGVKMEYIDNDHIATYVYLADIFWHSNNNNASVYIAFRARQNMVAKINNGTRGELICVDSNEASKLILEKYMVGLME